MGFMDFNKEEVGKLQEDTGGGLYLTETGIYDVTLKVVQLDTTTNGHKTVNFILDYNGNDKTIYNLMVESKEGKEYFGAAIFKKLVYVTGGSSITAPVNQPVGVKTQDGVKSIQMDVFEQFAGKKVKIRVQKEWSKYKGEVKSKLVIKGFYTQEGLTSTELAAGRTEPEQMFKDEKYLKDSYKDGLTEATVGTTQQGSSGSQSAAQAEAPEKNPFEVSVNEDEIPF